MSRTEHRTLIQRAEAFADTHAEAAGIIGELVFVLNGLQHIVRDHIAADDLNQQENQP